LSPFTSTDGDATGGENTSDPDRVICSGSNVPLPLFNRMLIRHRCLGCFESEIGLPSAFRSPTASAPQAPVPVVQTCGIGHRRLESAITLAQVNKYSVVGVRATKSSLPSPLTSAAIRLFGPGAKVLLFEAEYVA